MQHIAPLLQTLLWVVLIGGIVIKYNKPIYGLLIALQRRIEAGSPLEAGPFKLGADAKPTPPEKQRIRAEAELKQIISEQLEPFSKDEASTGATLPSVNLRSRFFQAEELALRALQAEFSAPINRQVSFGSELEADGAFVLNSRLHIVDVKFIVRPKNATSTIRRTLQHYNGAFGRYRRATVTIVLALVFQFEGDVEQSTLEFAEIAREFPLDVVVRGYALATLQRIYGLPDQDSD